MSEGELVNEVPAELALQSTYQTVDADDALDEDASALLNELEDSQVEVQRMLESQREQAAELGGMKDQLQSELLQLQDDAWKLQVFAELEMLKRQLAAINSLDADLDAMEAKLDETEGDQIGEDFDKELAAARAGTMDLLSKLGGVVQRAAHTDGEANRASLSVAEAEMEGEDVEDVSALQDELDAELASLYKQLQAIKAESAMVSARKAQLELELMQLVRDGEDELVSKMQDLDVVDAEECQEGAEEGDSLKSVTVAESSGPVEMV